MTGQEHIIPLSLENNAGASEYTGPGIGKSRGVAGAPERGNEGNPCFPPPGVPPWAGRLRAFPKSGEEAPLLTAGGRRQLKKSPVRFFIPFTLPRLQRGSLTVQFDGYSNQPLWPLRH